MNSKRSKIFHIFSKLINWRGWNKNYDCAINHMWKNKEFNLYMSAWEVASARLTKTSLFTSAPSLQSLTTVLVSI